MKSSHGSFPWKTFGYKVNMKCLFFIVAFVLQVSIDGFILQKSHHVMIKSSVSSKNSRRYSPSSLYMIDNFFRLHETNRELDSQYDDLFAKNKYDDPHAFGSSVFSFANEKESGSELINPDSSFKLSVEGAFNSAMNQLPACGEINFVIAMIQEEGMSKSEAEVK